MRRSPSSAPAARGLSTQPVPPQLAGIAPSSRARDRCDRNSRKRRLFSPTAYRVSIPARRKCRRYRPARSGCTSASHIVGNVTGVNTSPMPRPTACSPPTKNATSAPSVRESAARRARGHSSFQRRLSASSTLAASELPPPRPAPSGMRFSSGDRRPGSGTRCLLERVRSADRQVFVDAHARHLVRAHDRAILAQRDRERIREVDEREQGLDVVIAVVAAPGHVEKQVDLCRRSDDDVSTSRLRGRAPEGAIPGLVLTSGRPAIDHDAHFDRLAVRIAHHEARRPRRTVVARVRIHDLPPMLAKHVRATRGVALDIRGAGRIARALDPRSEPVHRNGNPEHHARQRAPVPVRHRSFVRPLDPDAIGVAAHARDGLAERCRHVEVIARGRVAPREVDGDAIAATARGKTTRGIERGLDPRIRGGRRRHGGARRGERDGARKKRDATCATPHRARRRTVSRSTGWSGVVLSCDCQISCARSCSPFAHRTSPRCAAISASGRSFIARRR